MNMPPQSKVSQSPYYNQILDWIDGGKSSRWISRELKNQFGENIGHGAISNFRNKHIKNEALEIVDAQLREESEEESKEKEVIQNTANRQIKGNSQIQGLADATARQYRGVLNVADNFEDDYYALKEAAKNENSKVNEKDVADVSFKAVKLAHDIQNGSSMDNSITEGFGELADAIRKSKEIANKG